MYCKERMFRKLQKQVDIQRVKKIIAKTQAGRAIEFTKI